MKNDITGKKIGRPLSFDRDTALYQAMLLFWRHGYEGTSLNELTSAMAVTPPSVYAAFGDKKRLFLEAVRLYLSGPESSAQLIARAPTARAAAAAMLEASAIGFTGEATPPGCLLASSTISCSAAAADVQAELTGIRLEIEANLVARIADDVAVGNLAPDVDATCLAGHVMAVIQGMSTLARDGAGRNKLLGIASMAMAGWPPATASGPRARD